jgi:hypothetical protein
MPQSQDNPDNEDDLAVAKGDTPKNERDASSGESAEPEGPFAGLPRPVRQRFEFFMSQAMGRGSLFSPFWEKVTSEHVPELIKSMDRDAQLEFQDRQRNRYLLTTLVLIVVAMMAFLVVQLAPTNPDLLDKLVTVLVSFVGGFGGGYGFRVWREREK